MGSKSYFLIIHNLRAMVALTMFELLGGKEEDVFPNVGDGTQG
jgi:hypothetical protein